MNINNNDDDFNNNSDDNDLEPSKSQRKREAQAIKNLAVELVKLKSKHLKDFNLPDEIYNAITQAQHIKSHGGLRRQLQYIAKLLRASDLEPIQTAYQHFLQRNEQDAADFHELEIWRARLIGVEPYQGQEKNALTEFLQAHPYTERQQLRHLIKQAQLEHNNGKPVGASKALFRFLRDNKN